MHAAIGRKFPRETFEKNRSHQRCSLCNWGQSDIRLALGCTLRRHELCAYFIDGSNNVSRPHFAFAKAKQDRGVAGYESSQRCRGATLLVGTRLCNDSFRFNRRQSLLSNRLNHLQLSFRSDLRDSVQVPLAERRIFFTGKFLNLGQHGEQGQQLRDFALGLARHAGQVCLGIAIGVANARQCVGKFVGVEFKPLPVFRKLPEQHLVVFGLLDPARNFDKARLTCCLKAAFARNDLVDALRVQVSHRNWLEDAQLSDRLHKLFLFRRVEGAPWLRWIRPDAGELDVKRTRQSVSVFVCLVAGTRLGIKRRQWPRAECPLGGA